MQERTTTETEHKYSVNSLSAWIVQGRATR